MLKRNVKQCSKVLNKRRGESMKRKNMIFLAGTLAASMLIGGCSGQKVESKTEESSAKGKTFDETQTDEKGGRDCYYGHYSFLGYIEYL